MDSEEFCDIRKIQGKSAVHTITKITLSVEGDPRPDDPTQQDDNLQNQGECFAPR